MDEKAVVDLRRTQGIPAQGTYVFITDRVIETKGDSGYTNWLVFCKIIDDSPDRDKTAALNLSHSPNSRFRMENFMNAVGMADQGQITRDDIPGKTFRGAVVHREWNGEMRANIDTCMPYDPDKPREASDSQEGIGIPADTGQGELPF